MAILNIRDLQIIFTDDEGQATIAVDKINLSLEKGEILGIVGESGSGKSVTSLGIMGLLPSSGKISGGEIYFQDNQGISPVEIVSLFWGSKKTLSWW
jgi:peptide/nickel transport system ATP-binding protein